MRGNNSSLKQSQNFATQNSKQAKHVFSKALHRSCPQKQWLDPSSFFGINGLFAIKDMPVYAMSKYRGDLAALNG